MPKLLMEVPLRFGHCAMSQKWHFSILLSELADVRSQEDGVEKVFFDWRTNFLMSAGPLFMRRREGPHRFIQKRPQSAILVPTARCREGDH